MNARQKKMRRKEQKAVAKIWAGRLLGVALLIALGLFIEYRALVIMSDRPCVTATPAYAHQIGCDQK